MARLKIKLFVVFYKLIIFYKKVVNFFSKRIFKKSTNDRNANAMNNKVINDAADKMGVSIRKMPHGYFQLKYDNSVHYSISADFSFENLMAYKMCGNKLLTSTILAENELPVPVFKAFSLDDCDSALEFFLSRNKPVVVKPCSGTSGGKGITVGVSSPSAFTHSFAKALCFSTSVMVEDFEKGEDYRFTVLNGRVLTVVKRLPAYVVGDGVNHISSLIALKNKAFFDPTADSKMFHSITVDADLVMCLSNQCLTLKSIPEKAKKVCLRKISNASQGGEVLEVTEQCHSDYLKMAVRAANLMKTKLSGIDLIIEDIRSPYERGKAFINEVNTTPALYIVRETGVNGVINSKVGEEILKYAFDIVTGSDDD